MSSTKSEDDVLELLNSLDKQDSSEETKTTTPQAKTQATKEDDDILGFLDSLTDTSKNKIESNIGADNDTDTAQKLNTKPISTSDSSNPTSVEKPSIVKAESPGLPDPLSSLTSWWNKSKGGLWDTATTAVKQAEAKVRELQPEVSQTQKQAMESLNDSISKFKLNSSLIQSTLSSVLDTIAPPIVRHEQLHIHVFHDMVGYPSIDNIVYSIFERVMQQVEGGGPLIMNVQKGKERFRRGSDTLETHELNIFKGPIDHAQKLAAASIDEFLHNTEKIKPDQLPDTPSKSTNDGDEKLTHDSTSTNETSFVRSSNVYLSIQPCSTDTTQSENASNDKSEFISSSSPRTFQFVVYLNDPDHKIQFSTVSQSFPLQWAEWLDSSDSQFENSNIDPREWVVDWVEEGLGLAIGIVAQAYVCKRMGSA